MATSALAVQNWFETTLSSSINASDTTISLNAVPTGTEGYLVIEPDSATNREVIYYTSKTSSTVLLPSALLGRGLDNTTAQSHSSGATVRMEITSGHFNALFDMTGVDDDAVLARHINWAGTGANGGIWWEELGRTTLGSAGDTIAVSAFTARKYIRVIYSALQSGQIQTELRLGTGGSIDSGNNYAYRYSGNGAADSTSTGQSVIRLTTAESSDQFGQVYIINISAKEKLVFGQSVSFGSAGAASSPTKWEITGKWVNTSAQANILSIINSGTGDFATGSEVIVLGHD